MDPLKPGCATVGETAGYKKQGAGSLKRNGRIQRERERGVVKNHQRLRWVRCVEVINLLWLCPSQAWGGNNNTAALSFPLVETRGSWLTEEIHFEPSVIAYFEFHWHVVRRDWCIPLFLLSGRWTSIKKPLYSRLKEYKEARSWTSSTGIKKMLLNKK